MAERPVFVPSYAGSQLVHEVPVTFNWHPGLAPSQKKKNITELHGAAKVRGLSPLLEISSKSDKPIGQRLSAFSLRLELANGSPTIECIYQGSKVFERAGPFVDLYWLTSREAKRDPRLKESGKLVGFRFEGEDYPTSPASVFYDWLYFKAIYPHRDWLKRRHEWAGFTDIEFNPERSLNCQARSFAAFISLQKRGELEDVLSSFEKFRGVMQASAI